MAIPLRVAVVGTGFGGRIHLPVFAAHPGFDLVAVCSARRERAEAIADRFRVPRAYDDFTHLLRDGGCDVVSIASPPATHAPYAIAAGRAGLHVLCEKPTALNAVEAQQMREAAAAAGTVALVNHEFRYLPGRARLHRLVRDGRVGQPCHLTLLQRSPWAANATGWLTDAAAGGGVLGSLGAHLIDASRWLLGEIEGMAGVAERLAAGGTAEDTASCILRHAGGAHTTIDLAGTASTRSVRFEVHGSRGWLRLEETEGGDRLTGPEGEIALADPLAGLSPLRHPLPAERLAPPFAHMLNHLLAAVNGAGHPAATLADGVRIQRVMDAIRAGALCASALAGPA